MHIFYSKFASEYIVNKYYYFMKKIFTKYAMPISGLLVLAGCVDNSYDLDNIDKTSAIKVNNLTVPVNLETITLDQVLDLDEEDGIIVKYKDRSGKEFYAIKKSGEVNPTDIHINEINASAPKSLPSLNIAANLSFATKAVNLPFENILTDFEYDVTNVDASFNNNYLTEFTLSQSNPLKIAVKVNTNVTGWKINDLVLALPAGFIGSCNGTPIGADGSLTVGNITSNSVVNIEVEGLDLTKSIGPQGLGVINNAIELKGRIGVKSGSLVLESIPNISSFTFNMDFDMSGFTVTTVSGGIDYHITPPAISDVYLSDLPDFLKDSGTQIQLANPQIYLSVINGSAGYGVDITSGLTLRPTWNEEGYNDITLPSFGISGNNPSDLYNMVLAPDPANASMSAEYSQLDKVVFTGLSNVLFNEYLGLPSSIGIMLNDPAIKGNVKRFPLGSTLTFGGTYTFFCPLEFYAGSKIVYSKKETDLFGDDVKDIDVDLLQLTANVNTDLPFGVNLLANPLDKDGNVIKDKSGNPVEASAYIPANAKNHDLNLNFNSFSGLDGVYFKVEVNVEDEKYLSPDQTITLNNIRAKVTGKYITDF